MSAAIIRDPVALAEHLQCHVTSGKGVDDNVRHPAPPVKCADGFKVSIQASQFHYSTPRSDTGPYTEFELGYPSAPMPALGQYAEDPGDHAGTVFAYVPIAPLVAVLLEHGGILVEEQES